MRYSTDIIAKGVYDYYAGVSLNKIRDGIDAQFHVQPADSAVYGWVRLLTNKALNEANEHPIKVSDKWIADETVVTLDGRKYWHIDIIDSDTRYLLAAKLSTNRSIKDIEAMLRSAEKRASKSPKTIVSDGWVAYPEAIERVFGAEVSHIVGNPFKQDELNTNLIERWHGTLKDRLKPMRGMDRSSITQLVLDGFILNYNYFRSHESLGKTPAEAAKASYPFRSWFDVVSGLKPEPELLPVVRGKRVAYRSRKPKIRRVVKDTETSIRRLIR
jgi:transposase-like protein